MRNESERHSALLCELVVFPAATQIEFAVVVPQRAQSMHLVCLPLPLPDRAIRESLCSDAVSLAFEPFFFVFAAVTVVHLASPMRLAIEMPADISPDGQPQRL